MKALFLTIGISLLMTGCVSADGSSRRTGTELTTGMGRMVERRISVTDFSSIDAGLGLHINYTVGSGPSCTVQAPEQLFEYLDLRVDGRTFVAGVKTKDGKGNIDRSISEGLKDVVINVSSSRLTEVDASTGSTVTLQGSYRTDGTLELDASTGAAITFRNITAGEVDAEVSTGASIVVSGSAEKAELEASTGGSIDASGLQVSEGSAGASTGASVTVKQKSLYKCSKSTGGSIR